MCVQCTICINRCCCLWATVCVRVCLCSFSSSQFVEKNGIFVFFSVFIHGDVCSFFVFLCCCFFFACSVFMSMFQSDLMLSSLGLHVMNGDERNLYVYCCWHFDSWDSHRSSGICSMHRYVKLWSVFPSTYVRCSSCIVSSHTDAHKSAYMHKECAQLKLYLQHLVFPMIKR